jgi:phospholipid/cholesterol/gamma-HCH transport system substrate-binding protein
MPNKIDLQLKVGIFVTAGVALTMLSILLLGGADSVFKSTRTYVTHFPAIDGLIEGAKVVIGGVTVGAVSDADFDGVVKAIRVEMKVESRYAQWIREDSAVELLTQGVLGDKFISLSVGTPESPALADGGEIQPRPTQDLSQVISKSDALMGSLNSLALSLDRLLKTFETSNRSEIFFAGMAKSSRNLAEATTKLNEGLDSAEIRATVKNLNAILEKVNNGSGTIGALINDPQLYYDARSLVGGANRNRIVRNLVRQAIQESEKSAEKK